MKKVKVFILCVILFLTLGCSWTFHKNYGGIVPDKSASDAFDNYRINTDYNYFISGSSVNPNAMIGLHKKYTLDSTLWKRFEPTPQTFREIIMNMNTKALEIKRSLHGFSIIDEKGNKIGEWHSILSVRTVVKMNESGKVSIATPDLDTYERHLTEGVNPIK